MTQTSDEDVFVVVMNEEEQYSVWWVERPLPGGWRSSGFQGTRAACLAHIEEVWTDIRPLSLRRSLATGSPASP
jgi:MbtH protein